VEPERCAECGFDGTRLTIADAVTALRSMGRRWRELFEDVESDRLRERPAPNVWSALEYAAHTRDVLRLHRSGLGPILAGEEPTFPGMEPEDDGPDHGYNALDPPKVLDDLDEAAGAIADRAERELPSHWDRTATIEGRKVEAGWLLRHAVHDASHHLRDVERGLGL
jgi:hypothetical protein